MEKISTNKLVIAVLANVILGVICGLYLPGIMLALSFVGQIYVNILQIIFIPLVAAAIITAVSSYTDGRQRGKAVLATLSFFAATSIIAIIIGLVTVSIFQPGAGVSTGVAFIPDEIASVPISQTLGFFEEIVPLNMVKALTMGKFLGWIIALIVAASFLGGLGRNAAPVTKFFETIEMVMQKLLYYVVIATPFAIFFLVGAVVARNSGYLPQLGGGLLKLSLTLLTAFLVHALVVIPLLLKFFGGRSPIEYFKNIFPALFTTLATASPTAALAVTYENSMNRNKLDSRSAALVLPLGTSLNVDGRAMYVIISAMFIAQAYGIELGLTGTLYLAAVVFLFSLGTATVPFAAMMTLALVFDAAGFPSSAYAGIGIIFAVDWFWGRNFAALDVWSDTAVAAAVEEVSSTAVFQKKSRKPARVETTRTQRSPRTTRPAPGRGERKYEDSRRDSRSTEGARKPFGKPDTRTPVRVKPARPKAPSPFELKPERSKSFDPESAKARDRAPFEIGQKEVESSSESARKTREKSSYRPKEKKETAPKRKTPLKVKVAASSEMVSPPIAAVPPPPLIRDLDPVAKENPPEKATEAVEIQIDEILKSAPEPEVEPVVAATPEKQIDAKPATESLEPESSETESPKPEQFGRLSHRKGPRPKTGGTSAPPADEPEFSTKSLEFGRKGRKKSPK